MCVCVHVAACVDPWCVCVLVVCLCFLMACACLRKKPGVGGRERKRTKRQYMLTSLIYQHFYMWKYSNLVK